MKEVASLCIDLFQLGEKREVTIKKSNVALPRDNNICSKTGTRLCLDVVAHGHS